MALVNVNGYMGSGRSAVTDLFREFEGFSVPNSHDEFQLLNHRDGLLALYEIVKSENHAVFSEAILRFITFTKYLERKPKGIQKLYQWGINYDDRYHGFSKITGDFIESICLSSWDATHPDMHINYSAVNSFLIKLKSKFLGTAPWPKTKFFLMNRDEYQMKFIKYLEDVLDLKNGLNVVVNNAFEINNCSKYFKLFNDPVCINVDRDIRDMYLSMILAPRSRYKEHYLRISGAFDVKKFGAFQHSLHSNNDGACDKVLNIKFEDLIFNYTDTVTSILNLTNSDLEKHCFKHKYFDPDRSSNNIMLWKKNNLNKTIISDLNYLENKYPELCYM